MRAIECHVSQFATLLDLALKMSHCNHGFGAARGYAYAEALSLVSFLYYLILTSRSRVDRTKID